MKRLFSIGLALLCGGDRSYALTGRGVQGSLEPVNASQEFWHRWRTFHPETRRY